MIWDLETERNGKKCIFLPFSMGNMDAEKSVFHSRNTACVMRPIG